MQHSDRIMPKVLRELLELELYPAEVREADATFTEFANHHATSPRISPNEVIARARREFPSFEADVRASCR